MTHFFSRILFLCSDRRGADRLQDARDTQVARETQVARDTQASSSRPHTLVA
jgi:hypothetical protein